jgi:hypothetical protein
MQIENYSDTQIYKIPNFVNSEFCDTIITLFNQQPKDIREDSSWSNKNIQYGAVKSESIKQLINAHRFDRTIIAQGIFKQKLYPDFTDICSWLPGTKMELHPDSCFLNGTPNGFSYRVFSSILYLNDDYEGGHTFFAKNNISVKPKRGMLLIFPSNYEYRHGVEEILNGDRFTLSMWFTDNINFIEM